MPGLKHHIIGLCGFANAGKDTVADLLVTHAGFVKLAWADALRAEIAEAYDVDLRTLTDRETKEQPTPALALRRAPHGLVGAVMLASGHDEHFGALGTFLDAPRSPRQILQWWGTEYRRRQDPNYWTRQLVRVISYRMETLHERNFVITDCRFANEVAALRNMGGELWQVVRPGATGEASHASVTDGQQFGPDRIILNSHDIRHLQQLVLGSFWARDAGLRNVKVEVE